MRHLNLNSIDIKSKIANSRQILSVLDSEMAVWKRVHWRLLEENFLGGFIWIKDNLVMVKKFVGEIKTNIVDCND